MTNGIMASSAVLGANTAPAAILSIGAPAVVAVVGCFCLVGIVGILCDKQVDADIPNLRFTVCDSSGHRG
ncbi:MAG: hypothetical protein IKG11_01170 [Atopobiaceae bacterium]|nr:hypothetical protein [Atopobiaceae bacterium]